MAPSSTSMAIMAVVACSLLQGVFGFGSSCSTGPVGTCSYLPCYLTRGPTQCRSTKCMCKAGYCAVSTPVGKDCRAETGSCTVVHYCWNGGLGKVTCEKTLDGSHHCLCLPGMSVDKDGKCVLGTESVQGNMTTQELAAFEQKQRNFQHEANMNAIGVVMLFAGVLAVPLVAAALAVWRWRRSTDTQVYLSLD
mmetsp:Transcript_95525/g.165959  ORF Transcript_95525/g.165959 Transcript_95525/m.165959 type:complete len:193 (+) Transcript_95525:20-598(+)